MVLYFIILLFSYIYVHTYHFIFYYITFFIYIYFCTSKIHSVDKWPRRLLRRANSSHQEQVSQASRFVKSIPKKYAEVVRVQLAQPAIDMSGLRK